MSDDFTPSSLAEDAGVIEKRAAPWYNSYTILLRKKLVILSANGEKLTWKSLELREKTVCPALDRL